MPRFRSVRPSGWFLRDAHGASTNIGSPPHTRRAEGAPRNAKRVFFALLAISLLANSVFLSRELLDGGEAWAAERNAARGTARWIGDRGLEWVLGTELAIPEPSETNGESVPESSAPCFDPPIAGRWFRTGERSLRFQGEQPIPRATRYALRLEVGAAAALLRGAAAGPIELSLSTPGPILRRASLVPRMQEQVEVVLDFDLPVELESLRSRLELSRGAGERARLLELTPARAEHERPRALFALPSASDGGATELRLRLEAGVATPLGKVVGEGAELRLPFDRRVHYEGSFLEQEGDRFALRARFGGAIELATARSRVTTDPPRELRLSHAWDGFVVHGAFAAGERVRVRYAAGIAAEDGRALAGAVEEWLQCPDLEPRVDFATAGAVLLASGARELELSLLNVAELELTAWRLFPNQIANWSREHSGRSFASYLGRPAGREIVRPALVANQRTRVATGLDAWLSARAADGRVRGTYFVRARDTRSWSEASRVVTVTDLALTARCGDDEALVWVTEIASGRPLAEVEVEIRSLGDQPLARARTDASGLAHVRSLADRAEGEPWIAIARRGDDTAFLELEGRGVVLGADAVGRPWKSGADAFVFCERELARPGETLHFGGWLRDELGRVRTRLDLDVALERPDGRVASTHRVAPAESGWFEGVLALPIDAPTGRWRVAVRGAGGPELGETTLRVEDFRPDRLRVAVDLPAQELAPGEPEVLATARVQRASGGAARDLRATAHLRVRASEFRPPADPRFVFAAAVEPSALPEIRELAETRTDGEGLARFDLALDDIELPCVPLDMEVVVTALEEGGRAVSGRALARVIPSGPYLACALPSGSAHAGAALDLEIGAFARDGSASDLAEVELLLERVAASWVLRRGAAGSEWELVDEVIAHRAVRVPLAGGRGSVSVPEELRGGRLRWSTSAPGAAHAVGAAGVIDERGSSAEGAPDRIALRFEPPCCAPGEIVRLIMASPFAGTGLLTLERQGIEVKRVLAIAAGTSEIELRADAAWLPSLHAALSVVRANPGGESAARAIGTARLALAPAAQPELEMSVRERVRPEQPLEIEVRARGARAGDEVVLWAIDEAVLAMSGAELPDPRSYFLAARAGLFETRDVFDRLLPEPGREAVRLNAVFGGDEDEPGAFLLASRARPKREEILGQWLGRIELDGSGCARAACVLGPRSGSLRCIALLATGTSFARAERTVLVREDLEIELALPGALAPGDRAEVPVVIRASEATAAGACVVELRTAGALTLRTAPRLGGLLEAGGELTLWCGIEASEASRLASGAGTGKLFVRATSGRVTREIARETAVRRADAPQTRRGSLRIEGRASFAPANELAPLERGCELELSRAPWIGLEGALGDLVQYPWGCLEQILSRARPLLEVESFAAIGALEAVTGEHARGLVQRTLERLREHAAPDGGLALWPGGDESYAWGTIAAIDFALAARARHHEVDEDQLRSLVAWCERTMPSLREDLERAGAIEVLVRAGRTPERSIEALRTRASEIEPEARAILARALRVAGRIEDARALLPSEPPAPSGIRERGGALRSDLRAAAQWLLAAAELEVASSARAEVLMRLCEAVRSGELGSTQEAAWVLRAIARVAAAEARAEGTASVELAVAGRAPMQLALAPGETRRVALDVPPHAAIEICSRGAPVFAAWRIRGFSAEASASTRSDGMRAERHWLTPGGAPLEGGVEVGQLVLVELRFDAVESCANAIAIDPLPAGFEIENPHLATRDARERDRSAVPSEDGGALLAPDRIERLADRLALFCDLPAGRSRFRYTVRAIQPGSFAQAPFEVQAAYDARLGARTTAGRIEVVR